MTMTLWTTKTMTTTPTDLTPQLLTYRFSSSRITAFSTLRQGGVSTGPYAAFNIAPHCGDTPAHVRTNHSLLARHIGLPPERIILPHQVHQTRLLRIDSNFFDLDDEARAASLEGVDALCTDMADVVSAYPRLTASPYSLPTRNITP